MKTRFTSNEFQSRLICILSLAWITVSNHGADSKWALPAETAKFKNGPGVDLVQGQCILCHSADYISTQPRLTGTQWRATVTKMQLKYGAPIMTNTVDRLVDYLSKSYGVPSPKR